MIGCKEYFSAEKKRLAEKVKSSGKDYRLDIVQIGDNPASNAYVRGKLKDCEEVGIQAELFKYPAGIPEVAVRGLVSRRATEGSDGIIIQLPVPKHIGAKTVLKYELCTGRQDVDGMTELSPCTPCTARGIIDWLDANHIRIDGKNAVVIGRGEIAGKAIAEALLKRNATVTICHSHTYGGDIEFLCRSAEIVVVAVGDPHWFKYDCPYATVIDVGISRVDGKLVGDVDPRICAKYVTPVPGGVGLLTRIGLLKNVIGE